MNVFRGRLRGLFLIVGLLCFMFLLMPAGMVGAEEPPEIQIYVDGQRLLLDTPPLVEQGRTLLPLRAVFESLGADVGWDTMQQKITAVKGDTTLILYIGNRNVLRNGETVILDVPPKIINNRTLVPLRFVGESLGANVNWDGFNRRVTIVSESQGQQPPTTPLPDPIVPDPAPPSYSLFKPPLTLMPGLKPVLPDWALSWIKLPLIETEYDTAKIYKDMLAVDPSINVLQIVPKVDYNKPWYNVPRIILWPTGCDYTPYMTFQGNQDGRGGCIGRSIIHVMNILKEREHPYTPDLSFWYLHARQEELAAGGPPDTQYVLEHNGICSEATFPSNYDKVIKTTDSKGKVRYDYSAMQQPSFSSNLEASLYKVKESEPYEPTVENIKHLLRNFGPLVAGGPLVLIQGPDPEQGHAVTIVGYDDVAKTVKCLNSWGDTWGNEKNGYFTVPYSKLAENFKSVRYYINIPSDRTGTSHAYSARIHLETGATSRNKLTVQVGVSGKDPFTVWDTPDETLWVDKSKTLKIDVPLPSYAKDHWPPQTGTHWYVRVTNHSSTDTATLKEFTLARLYKNANGSFATETFKTTDVGAVIGPGKTETYYVPKATLIISPIKIPYDIKLQ